MKEWRRALFEHKILGSVSRGSFNAGTKVLQCARALSLEPCASKSLVEKSLTTKKLDEGPRYISVLAVQRNSHSQSNRFQHSRALCSLAASRSCGIASLVKASHKSKRCLELKFFAVHGLSWSPAQRPKWVSSDILWSAVPLIQEAIQRIIKYTIPVRRIFCKLTTLHPHGFLWSCPTGGLWRPG